PSTLRDAHSFPTRRSSDLGVRNRGARPRHGAGSFATRRPPPARPAHRRARARPRARTRLDAGSDGGVGDRARRPRAGCAVAGRSWVMPIRAVLLDVDFTLARPGPELGPEGYRRRGEQFGLELDSGRYEDARAAAVTALERHPELEHDEEIWVAFTERIVRGM